MRSGPADHRDIGSGFAIFWDSKVDVIFSGIRESGPFMRVRKEKQISGWTVDFHCPSGCQRKIRKALRDHQDERVPCDRDNFLERGGFWFSWWRKF
jgi:hypothetical protein